MQGFRSCTTSIDFTDEANAGNAGPPHLQDNRSDPTGHERVHDAKRPDGVPPCKHFVIVRDDLPPGLQAAEIVHAAGDSAALRAPPPGTHAVALIASPPELHRLAARLGASGAPLVCVYEDVDPFKDALVAIGLAPGYDGRLLRHLPLLGRERGRPPP